MLDGILMVNSPSLNTFNGANSENNRRVYGIRNFAITSSLPAMKIDRAHQRQEWQPIVPWVCVRSFIVAEHVHLLRGNFRYNPGFEGVLFLLLVVPRSTARPVLPNGT